MTIGTSTLIAKGVTLTGSYEGDYVPTDSLRVDDSSLESVCDWIAGRTFEEMRPEMLAAYLADREELRGRRFVS